MEYTNNDINTVAMEVILNAGNGRTHIDEALQALVVFDFTQAEKLLQSAEEEIVKAHIAQTKVIQSQVCGETVEYSLLFVHAQDTIMTINTELRMVKQMMPIFQALHDQRKKG